MKANRSDRQMLAAETVTIVRTGRYMAATDQQVEIAPDLEAAVSGTRLYTPGQLEKLPRRTGRQATRVEVTNETTLAAGHRLYCEGAGSVLALNFASAKNPGGGFLSGAAAQEESLARASGLIACLEAKPRYYDVNRHCGSALYTDHLIYSPDVPVFRDDEGRLLDDPWLLTIVTSPAPNAGAVRTNEPNCVDEIEPTLRRRIGHVLAVAADNGHRTLVLGAWGCGVFQNDPAATAELFADHLEHDFSGAFDRIVFAVLDTTKTQSTFTAFRDHLAEGSGSIPAE